MGSSCLKNENKNGWKNLSSIQYTNILDYSIQKSIVHTAAIHIFFFLLLHCLNNRLPDGGTVASGEVVEKKRASIVSQLGHKRERDSHRGPLPVEMVHHSLYRKSEHVSMKIIQYLHFYNVYKKEKIILPF